VEEGRGGPSVHTVSEEVAAAEKLSTARKPHSPYPLSLSITGRSSHHVSHHCHLTFSAMKDLARLFWWQHVFYRHQPSLLLTPGLRARSLLQASLPTFFSRSTHYLPGNSRVRPSRISLVPPVQAFHLGCYPRRCSLSLLSNGVSLLEQIKSSGCHQKIWRRQGVRKTRHSRHSAA